MNKYLLLNIFVICSACNFLFAQKEELKIENDRVDSVILHKVMLIPYDPLFYLSDAEQEIIQETKKEPSLIRASFRKAIDLDIKNSVQRRMKCLSILNDGDSIPSLNDALISIYSKTGYRYDKPMPLTFHPENADSVKKDKKNMLQKNAHDSRIATQYLTANGDAQYMNAVISKPGVLTDLYNQYGTDIFIFINQLEIKTNYKSCLDIANKIYRREVMVHFSIFDKNGKQLAGTYSMSFFPSDSNNAYDIMKNCFPDIAYFVANCIP
jgi:hypothetical protein